MQFGANQKLKFNAQIGSYSIVTEREHYDSQITATDSEAELLINFFGRESIPIGNVKSNKLQALKEFKLYPDGEKVKLNLVFPKPDKTAELRLYISSKASFKPKGNSVWFMFERDNALWIGSMAETEWRDENVIIVYDETEGAYQDSLLERDEIKINKLKARDIFSRDRNLALERIQIEKYQCEYNPSHSLFKSRYTHLPYLEAHHLIPMALQKVTPQKLDTLENIFSLCPYCHRAIHHADKDLTRDIIERLVHKRPEILNIMDIKAAEIFSFYSVEDIY
ncbi:MAG: HNH endonuclease [Methylovulum sp.]|nr:HNH endonuclease [Methylovulum sp.]